jgi:hypothetical protein
MKMNVVKLFMSFLFSTLFNSKGELAISDISAVLKKVIVPTIQNQLPKESVLFDKIKKNVGVTIANNNIYVSARTGKHTGIYSVAEGTEPKSGKASYGQPYTSMKYAFGTLELTDQAIEAAKDGNVKAIASILSTEIAALKDDFKMDLNRQFHGAGTGVLCYTTGTGGTTSTTVTVDNNPHDVSEATDYLEAGMYIDIGTSHTAVQIVSKTATTIVIAAGTAWVDGATITKTASAECMGLAGIIDDGDNVATIQNILRASYPYANAHTYDTATTLTEANMIATYLKTVRYGGAKVIMAGPTLYAKYGALLASMKRTSNSREVLSGGWKGLDFMGGQLGVMMDFDCWNGYIQMIDFDALTIAQMSQPFAWLEADAHGGILKRSADNRTIWEGTLKYYLELVALKFKSMARMSGQKA